MAGGVERAGDAHLVHLQTQLAGHDLRQRRGVALAAVGVAGVDGDGAVGFHAQTGSLSLAAQQLVGPADEHAVAEVRAARLHASGDADADGALALT